MDENTDLGVHFKELAHPMVGATRWLGLVSLKPAGQTAGWRARES